MWWRWSLSWGLDLAPDMDLAPDLVPTHILHTQVNIQVGMEEITQEQVNKKEQGLDCVVSLLAI